MPSQKRDNAKGIWKPGIQERGGKNGPRITRISAKGIRAWTWPWPLAHSRRRLIQSVNFDESIASRILITSHDRGVTSGRQCSGDSRFQIVWRRHTSAGDNTWLVIFPIIVKHQ